jgi:uncharacterized protein Yka (UPF0111/DUF47 family)
MQSLYEISSTYLAALSALTDPEQDIDAQTISDTMEGLDGTFEDKAINVAKYIADLEHQADGIREAAKRQKARYESLENKADRLRRYLLDNLQATGKTNINAPDIAVSVAKTPARVVVDDEQMIPTDYFRKKVTEELNKTKLKEALSAGQSIPGAHLETGFRVSIK